MDKNRIFPLAAVIAVLALSACGNKGPLVLPPTPAEVESDAVPDEDAQSPPPVEAVPTEVDDPTEADDPLAAKTADGRGAHGR